MRTLGVDLSAQPRHTAACVVDWVEGSIALHERVDDDALVELAGDADVVGIDAPFGYPTAFVDAVAAFARGGEWPDGDIRELRFRATDRFVHEQTGRWPLSVSSDLIALPAWRCLRLRSRLNGRRVVEVYPGAALSMWRLERRGYKQSGDARAVLVRELERRAGLPLDAIRPRCVDSDDPVDAFVAALVARAAAHGMTIPPPPELAARAAREGWIELPLADSLERLRP